MKAVLAIDIGTTTGWAVRTRDGNVVHDVAHFPPVKDRGPGFRFVKFRAWLADVIGDKVDAVYFERVHGHGKSGVNAAHLYGGFVALLMAHCEAKGIPYTGIWVQNVKKHWTGKGNANKDAMLAAARSRGFRLEDEAYDEADALAILHCGLYEGGAA